MAAAGVAIRFWSPAAAPAGRMPGVTKQSLSPTMAANARRLLGRADQPIDADVARLRGASGDELGHSRGIAGRFEVGVVE